MPMTQLITVLLISRDSKSPVTQILLLLSLISWGIVTSQARSNESLQFYCVFVCQKSICCALRRVRTRPWRSRDTTGKSFEQAYCSYHFRRPQAFYNEDNYNNRSNIQNYFHRFSTISCSEHSSSSNHEKIPTDAFPVACSPREHSLTQHINVPDEPETHDTDVNSSNFVTSSTSASFHVSASSPIQRIKHRSLDSSAVGKRAHYNEALLTRILNGRSSSSERWRRRTRRAAAALGINFTTIAHNIEDVSYHKLFTSWMTSTHSILGTKTQEKYGRKGSGTSPTIKSIPPMTSALLRSSSTIDDMDDSNSTVLSVQCVCDKTNPISCSTVRANSYMRDGLEATRKTKIKPLSSLLSSRPVRSTPLTREEYDRAKKEWTERYTNLSNLRSTFGTNRNKIWGDFDPETTRRLYKTLLPRALLGLYEMGLWSPTDLAPLAYEARLAAKKYARERCIVPGRIMSMVYDGFRSWRDWGTWNVEGMSWEQVWYKYETQILGELRKNCGEGHKDRLNVMQEEITALVCLRILERSCITNEAIDRLLLKNLSESTNHTFESDEGFNRYNIKKRKRKAERDIARISAQLERDMEELLKTSSSKSMFNTTAVTKPTE